MENSVKSFVYNLEIDSLDRQQANEAFKSVNSLLSKETDFNEVIKLSTIQSKVLKQIVYLDKLMINKLKGNN